MADQALVVAFSRRLRSMALGATIYRFQVTLSDVDRGVYEALDVRLARHPSENVRYLLTRLFAYCLSYEPGIAFSKGGLSAAEEAPLSVVDPTGLLLVWIDVGVPSAERLHKASKAARRVVVYSAYDRAQLVREASARTIHKLEEIEVFLLPTALLAALEEKLERNCSLEIVRNEGQLYVTVAGAVLEGKITETRLLEE